MKNGVYEMVIGHDLMCVIIRDYLNSKKMHNDCPIVITVSQSKRNQSFTVKFDKGNKP